MSESFELRPISPDSIGGALQKAERYRLLNQPEQAESICLDILDVDPGNQQSLVMLILALTDQLGAADAHVGARKAHDYIPRLTDEYSRAYYSGIIVERQARAFLNRGRARGSAFEAFREAMDCFEKAAAIRPDGDDDALLRWNSCVRTIRGANLQPRFDEGEPPLE
jgi:tetratricopeptide (TPR) repeat protein